MADMIDAAEAKKLLGCDDAALNNHINSGGIRAQRVAGKLMLNRDDVDKLATKAKEDDGTIVLTGDSDELSVDLGKVVDDASETIAQPRKEGSSTESITFGDELEVVSFDDGNTKDLNFDQTKATQGAGNLSFTDSNTAVMTAVDETGVGATTAPVDFQTSQGDAAGPESGAASSRRSVRSSRGRAEEVQVHWIWPAVMVLTLVIGISMIIPYYFLAIMPHGLDEKDAAKNILRGLDDNGWTNMASGIAGFSVEPDPEKYKRVHPEGEYKNIKDQVDPQAEWRYKQYQGELTGKGERIESFVIISVEDNGNKAKPAKGNKIYDVRKVTTSTASGAIDEMKPDLGFPK
jgi:hypothetical protein